MEKVRVALEWLKKYHFWILCVLIVVLVFGTWFLATSDRADAFAKGKEKIDGKLKEVQSISRISDHPSQPFIELVLHRESGPLRTNVANASTVLFDDQRKNNALPIIYPDNPKEQARFEVEFNKVWNHKIEDIEHPPAGANPDEYVLSKDYCNEYRDRFKEHIPELFNLIELRTRVVETEPAEAQPRAIANGPPEERYKGCVDWPGSDDLERQFHDWNDTPKPIQVMLAQEELWVYEALLRVIRNTNDRGDDPKHDKNSYRPPRNQKEARIKKIDALDIGEAAAQSWTNSQNAIFTLGADASGGTAAAVSGPSVGMGGGRIGAPSWLPGTGAASTAGASLLTGRYVDNDGKPVADLSQDPNKEFRMMPIDMKVIIEQKAIPRLLVECANSNMRIDVRAVRILAEKPPAFDLSGGSAATDTTAQAVTGPPNIAARTAGRSGRDYGGRDIAGAAHGQGAGLPGGDAESYAETAADATSPPVLVEIQGIIYIYNPPTVQAQGGEAAVAAGASPAAVPTVPAPAGSGTPPAAPGTPPPAGALPTPPATTGARP